MDVELDKRAPGVSALLVAGALVLLAGGLVAQIALATSAAADATDPAAKKTFVHLAWLALVMLAFDALISFWLVVRVLSARSRRLHIGGPTPYVDAWSAAGRRFKLDDSDQDDADDSDDDSPGDAPG